MTFGSLFAGIGGLDLGLERAGMQCKWQCEIDPFALRVLAKHWPSVHRHDDIRTFTPPCGVDLICGGFPCQDISLAGTGAGLQGARSGLFYEGIRVIAEVKPRWVLLENVSALLTRGLGDVLSELAALGFDAEWHCIPAAYVGAPHVRDRVFVIANANGKLGPARLRILQQDRKRKQVQTQNDGERIDAYQWSLEAAPRASRMDDGFPDWVDRVRCLGNAVVPQVAELVGRAIMELD